MSEADTPAVTLTCTTFSIVPVTLLMLVRVSPIFGPDLASGDCFSFLETFHLGKSLLIAGVLELGQNVLLACFPAVLAPCLLLPESP